MIFSPQNTFEFSSEHQLMLRNLLRSVSKDDFAGVVVCFLSNTVRTVRNGPVLKEFHVGRILARISSHTNFKTNPFK